jgi:NADH-quinone oxidoreductase subunit H
MDVAQFWEWVIKSAFLLAVMTGGFAYLTLFERRVLARLQVRIGPNRAGPFGILQPIADGVKLIFKEELIPAQANKFMFILAPVITVFPALVITAVIPWGESIFLFGREIPLHLADINVGVLYLVAIASIAVYGIALAGWASNNKYAMMGGLRATAQMISYELALGLALVSPMILAGSMRVTDIIQAQGEFGWFLWLLFQPLGPIIFFDLGGPPKLTGRHSTCPKRNRS